MANSKEKGSGMTLLRRRTLLGAAGLSLATPAVRAQGRTSGVALVIGNSKYQWEAQLPNVKRDVPDIAKRFEAFGLKTELVEDLGRDALRKAVDKFTGVSRGAQMAAIYFAGHGASWNKRQFVVPVDADLSNPDAVKNLVRGGDLRDSFAGAANHLLVFDACRNNPADGWRQKQEENRAAGRNAEAGSNETDAPNTVVLFSTVPGRAALDGPAGQNSPFCAALLRQLAGGSVDLPSLPGALRRDLLIATQGRQVLWDRNNYRGGAFTLSAPPDAGARSQGGGDPRRVVELANAYAYAQQNGLTIPPGLIGYKPPAGSKDAAKVGAFKYTGYNQEAALLVVMSVEDPQNVELVQAYRDKSQQTKWRFLRGTLTGDGIDLENSDQNLGLAFKWGDANSGKYSIRSHGVGGAGGGSRMVTGSFARLD
jgi:hypothetical protein